MQYKFGAFTVDVERLEILCDGTRVPAEPQVFDLICHLITHRDRVVPAAELFDTIWQGRVVSDSTLTSRINAARRVLGDTGGTQQVIQTLARRGYRFVATVEPVEPTQSARKTPPLRQDIMFCTADNSIRIAYSRVGAGPPIVKTGNWLNHLEYDWESPVWSHLLRWFATDRQLIRYDARGNGLSDWDVQDISLDAFVRDLEAVVDAAQIDRFNLFGASQGCAVAIAYAARHPDRVRKLVLYGGFSRGRRMRGNPVDIEQAEAMIALMRTGWWSENPAFRQLFTSLFIPGATADQVNWFNELQRRTTSPDNAVKMRLVSDFLDVTELLPLVRAPTLVLHCREDAVQPMSEGRFIAARVPGARFVSLEGRNHLILESDPGWAHFRSEVDAFLAT